jgi:general secretion pathway protein G
MKINYQRYHQKSGNKGFTLIEIIVVMAIIALLLALVGPKVLPHLGKGKSAAAKAQIEMFGQALDQYRMDNHHYPTTAQGLQALITNPGEPKWDGPYLKKNLIPKDPWDRQYNYASPGSHGEYDLWSYGRDGAQGGEGEDADVSSWQ